ncbi:MAG: murein biosynthesis integral membrane protein MurJ [Proteobacteria bacterium]|nr:murein biosynthesis integral membrane protein MurJ [Pseudomonadota bacterium]
MSLFRSIATVGGYTLASRVLGFIRDILVAAFLGAGPLADAFIVTFRLPNLFRAFSAEGAFSAAFVPMLARLIATEGRQAALSFAEETLAVLIAVLGLFVLAVEGAMPWVLSVIAPGFTGDGEQVATALLFGRVMFPYLLLITLVAFLGSILNALGRFAAMASAPNLFNLVQIAALFAITPFVPTVAHALSYGVALAGIAQFIHLVYAAKRAGVRLRLVRPRLTPNVRRMLKLMVPATLGAGVTQVSLVISTVMATLLPGGSVAYLYYADRVAQLPLGVVGYSVGTALLPLLTQQLAREPEAANTTQNRALEVAALATLPAAAGLIALALPIVHVLFEHRAFSAEDAILTARALAAFAMGLPAFVLIKVMTPGYLARHDTATPVKIAAVAIAANLAIILALMPYLAHVGIAIGTSIAAWLNAGLLWAGLARRGQFHLDAEATRRLPRLALAALGMGGFVWWAAGLAEPMLMGHGLESIGALVLLIGAGGLAFALLVLATGAARPAELRSFLSRSPRLTEPSQDG